MLVRVLLAQVDPSNPILPETNDSVWTLATILAIAVPIAVIAGVVLYVVTTRRIAERALGDAKSLRRRLEEKRPGDT